MLARAGARAAAAALERAACAAAAHAPRCYAVDTEQARKQAQEAAARMQRAAGEPAVTPGNGAMFVFDRQLKTAQRDRAAWLSQRRDPLHEEVSERLLERLEDIKREFPTVLVLGGAHASVARRLAGSRAGVRKLIHVDPSRAQLTAAEAEPAAPGVERVFMQAHEEELSLPPGSVDLVISCLGLHWLNDLPGAMVQCRRALRPDGLFLSAFLGGATLNELRIACAVGEQEREGGISPRASPLAHVRDAGNLLGRAGLTLPAVDADTLTIQYQSALDLVLHLRVLGETNAVSSRRRTLRRDTALASAAAYHAMFGSGDGTSVPATYEVIYMAGWSPSDEQQAPKRRGTATVSFADLAEMVDADGTSGKKA